MKTAKSSSIAERMRMLRPKDVVAEATLAAETIENVLRIGPNSTSGLQSTQQIEPERTKEILAPGVGHQELIARLGGCVISNHWGSFWMRRQTLAADLSHGPVALHHATTLDPRVLRRINLSFTNLNSRPRSI